VISGEVFARDVECLVQIFELFAFGFGDEALVEDQREQVVSGGDTHKYIKITPMMHQTLYHKKAPNDVNFAT